MIKWNEITWYSRMATIVVFVGIMPVVNFFIGVQYERTEAALIEAQTAQVPPVIKVVHRTKPVDATTTISTALKVDANSTTSH